MNINHSDNIIQKMMKMDGEQQKKLELNFYLISKEEEATNYYRAINIHLKPKSREWLKKNIVKTLEESNIGNEGDKNTFNVGDYNHELQLHDKIAKFNVKKTELQPRVEGLLKSMIKIDPEFVFKKTNFQGVQIKKDNQEVTFFYYRGITKSTSKQKKIMRKDDGYDFIEDDPIISIGGKIAFFLIKDNLFILNPSSFEHAFNYRTHVEKLRDSNIEKITSLPFFEKDTQTAEIFSSSCKKYIYSRGLANIKAENFDVIERNFAQRCDELKEIKEKAPKEEALLEDYQKKIGAIWGLLEFIDVEQKIITFKEGDSPKLLIHFFGDKIVKSFLTEEVKIALGYQ